jgi:hypothetical protein
MPLQVIFMLAVLAAFVLLGFMLSRSIKKHDAKMAHVKKKKGRNRYMPEYKKRASKKAKKTKLPEGSFFISSLLFSDLVAAGLLQPHLHTRMCVGCFCLGTPSQGF